MLDLAGVGKSWGETVALVGVDLRFRAGEVHTILGENGSGKSTLVKLLSGVAAPDSGSITLDGRSIAGAPPRRLAALGVATVFQEVLVAPDLDVTENVLLGLDGLLRRSVPMGQRRARAAAALAQITPTTVALDARAGDLPLAQQQLVVVARALVRGPRALILDEATAALDLPDRERVFAAMRAVAAAGGAVLFISHRMDEVLGLSDRVSVLRAGRMVGQRLRGALDAAELLRLMAPELADA